jgi:Glycosyl hydrolase family 53
MRHFVCWSFGIAFLALQLSSCADEGLVGPPRPAPTPAPVVQGPPAPPPLPEYRGPATRSFYMGFTLWPADLTNEGVAVAKDFAHNRGDIVSVNFISGIPWPEAFDGKPFSKDVQANMAYRPPGGKKLFLSISPLNRDKRDLAPYWGETDNQPLPQPWDKEPLNSPHVKRAFLNFVLRSIDAMRPDYLAIGVESNVLLSRNQAKWRQLKELHRDTYTAVKKVHKALPVFFTTEVLHLRRLAREAKGTEQEKEVAELMRSSDLFAMSLYPYMSPEVPRRVPATFLDFATRFNKPIAVADSGMTSRTVELKSYSTTLHGSDTDQQLFTELLLKTAARDGYEFVINFATTDSDRLVARLRPPLDDIARIWAYTGMQTSDRRPKPASAVWDGFFKAKYEKAKWW